MKRRNGNGVLFVGQAPSRRSDEPLDGKTGAAIAKLLGIPHVEFLARFQRLNLNRKLVGRSKTGRADPYDRNEGELRAAGIAASETPRIVLLGRHVATSFGLTFDPLMIRREKNLAETINRYLILPHPSGLNRWWNDPRNRRAAQRKLRRFCR
jgi:uracil-DNA glycosylase